MANLGQKQQVWGETLVALRNLYSDGLQQYWDWLGDSFYPAIKEYPILSVITPGFGGLWNEGTQYYGLALPAQLGPDASPDQMLYYNQALELSNRLNFLNTQVFDLDRGEGRRLRDNWPYFQLTSQLSFHNDELSNLASQIFEDIKVILENKLISNPDKFLDEVFGPFQFGTTPPENIQELLEAARDKLLEYISLFPSSGATLKSDINPLPESNGLGPVPIISDINLESTIAMSSGKDHYIGMLEKNQKGNFVLPVRFAPDYDKRNLELGWDDIGYTTVSTGKFFVGLEIDVTEVIVSETGTWVGFLYDGVGVDAFASIAPSDDFAEIIETFEKQKKILYTEAKYIRIKESAISKRPDPYVSGKTLPSTPEQTANIPGSAIISPKDNSNWLKLQPDDVRLSYYNFNLHNKAIIGEDVEYTLETIESRPMTRYSEGYYYFIMGEAPRKNENQIKDESTSETLDEDLEDLTEEELEIAKKTSSQQAYLNTKETAWANLLSYLGKNTQGGNQNLRDQLYEKYFVPVASKVNTKSANPNNQKILFAIYANYIDAIPDTLRPYSRDFSEASEFYSGRNYAFAFPLKEIQRRCDYLVGVFEKIKDSVDTSRLLIKNPNNTEYDIQVQIDLLQEFPVILNDFLSRQSFPASTNNDFLSGLIKEGTETKNNHIIQIGVKDNNQIGMLVKETVSYVLFSPDPENLKDEPNKDFNLFYFDPFLSKEELAGSVNVKRSAKALRTGLPYLRSRLDGIYGSRTLHLLLAFNDIKKKLGDGSTEAQELWVDFLVKYSVPPVDVSISKDPRKANEEGADCDELIAQLNAAGPVLGLEERILQEKVYNNPECMQRYFDQFKTETPAVFPELSKKELEKKSQGMEVISKALNQKYVKTLYTGFFNAINPQALISLILACLQKKLGLPITAEAICEAAIVELIKSIGIDQVKTIIISNALLNPDDPSSAAVLTALGTSPTGSESYSLDLQEDDISSLDSLTVEEIDIRYSDSPIALAMAILVTNPITGDAGFDFKTIELIRNLENGGAVIDLVPALRPITNASEVIVIPDPIPGMKIANNNVFKEDVIVTEYYTWEEIEEERGRLLGLGYSRRETDGILVREGYLTPNLEKYSAMLTGDVFLDPLIDLSGTLSESRFSEGVDRTSAVKVQKSLQQAKDFLQYLKRIIDIQSICELVVGDVLEGLQDLITDPGAFLANFENGWWENFVDKLKRQLYPPVPTMKFPDSLSTDSHMGNYGELLLETLISLVATILGQIVQLLIKDALDKCLEENDDIGGVPNTVATNNPSVALPVLQRARLPQIGNLSDVDVVSWMKDLLDSLSTAQVCALLRGDATTQTLYDCLVRTRDLWPEVYSSGVTTIHDITSIFRKIGNELDLDICNELQVSAPILGDICDAVYDQDARCEELKSAGLTEEECEEQINSELQDLKEKVLGLVGLAMPGANPLRDAAPDICGDRGSFVMPPGVEDTMNRITDNMLTAVKGSLINDFTALKFFSTPPRAILAASSQENLAEAHKMFIDAAKDPFKINCMSLIGQKFIDPEYDSQYGSINRLKHKRLLGFYPITYDRYFHYGGLTTFGAQAAVRSDEEYGSTARTVASISQLGFNALSPTQLINTQKMVPISKYIAIENPTMFSKMNVNDIVLLRKDQGITIGDDNYLSENDISNLIGNTYEDDLFITAEEASASTKSLEELAEELSAVYNKDFLETVKPGYLNDATLNVEELFSYRFGTGFNSKSGGKIGDYDHLIPGPAYSPTTKTLEEEQLYSSETEGTGVQSYIKIGHLSYLNKAWPVNTKLKDINPNPYPWYGMCRAYTGVHITPLLTGFDYGYMPEWLINYNFSISEDGTVSDDTLQGIFEDYKAGAIEATGYTAQELSDIINITQAPEIQSVDQLFFPDFANEQGAWISLMKKSPGLVKLQRIIREELNKDKNFGDWEDDYFEDRKHNVVMAFMQLTLGEALGIEESHIKKIFPNLTVPPNPSVILTEEFGGSPERVLKAADGLTNSFEWDIIEGHFEQQDVGAVWVDTYVDITGTPPSGDLVESFPDPNLVNFDKGEYSTVELLHGDITPMYIVYEEYFRDPNSPLNAPAEEMIDYFSMKGAKTNPELYDSFNNNKIFPRSFGFAHPDDDVQTNTNYENMVHDAYNVSTTQNFNPNMLMYNLPFTELSVPGANRNQEILNVFTSNLGDDEQALALIEQFDISRTDNSLLYQNSSLPLVGNIKSSLGTVKDTFKLAKGKVRASGPITSNDISPPNFINDESFIDKEIFNHDYKLFFDSDVRGLLEEIYGGSVDSSTILSEYEQFKDIDLSLSKLSQVPLGDNGFGSVLKYPYSLEQTNFKSQVFGKLLTHKFMETFDKYYDPSKADDSQYVSDNREEFKKYLRFILSSYGYSALQFAYSNQMFSKLKSSRLHYRSFMKKLWNKVLSNPNNSSNVDPSCRQLFDQIGLTSRQDLENVETDFFNLDAVKEDVRSYYKKSLCFDVYGTGGEAESSAVRSLAGGVVKLIAKIYTLEMCMASIIAWDSFDISEVFKDVTIIKVVIDNIKQDHSIEELSPYINDVVKKEESLKDNVELVQFLKSRNQSGLEYIIEKESEAIFASIKELFNLSNPITTDLQLDLVKNSDPDFLQEFDKKIYVSPNSDWPENIKTTAAALPLQDSQFEYVLDARINNNIYTMNYAQASKRPVINSYVPTDSTPSEHADLFGNYPLVDDISEEQTFPYNKNVFHSLPFNHYGDAQVTPGPAGPSRSFFDDPGDLEMSYLEDYEQITGLCNLRIGFVDNCPDPLPGSPNAVEWEKLIKYYTLQHEKMGNADSFSHENFQETLHGNDLNAKLGNMLFQTYVKIEELTSEEREQFNIVKYNIPDGNAEPCEIANEAINYSAADYADIFEELDQYRNSLDPYYNHTNLFKCYMKGYVPLAVWSYYYNNVLLEKINTYQDGAEFPLKELYNKYGLAPFFKKISYGIRLTYVTSYPIAESSGLKFNEFMYNAFRGNIEGLAASKSLYSQRPYSINGKRKILREIHIPITEVEKDITFVQGTGAFTVEGSLQLIPMDQMGSWHPIQSIPDSSDIELISSDPQVLKYLIHNPHQFFYKNMAADLLSELKTTPEFKLLYEHLFPMKRYMSLAFLYAGDGLSKFIPEPTDVLSETKKSLGQVMRNLLVNDDYTLIPDPVANALQNSILRNEGGTRGLEPDVTKQILMILMKAPLMVLKGFVEVTDPAIIIAKRIIDIASMTQQAIVSALEQSLKAAKAIAEASLQIAKQSQVQIEIQAGPLAALANPDSLPSVGGTEWDNYVNVDTTSDNISEWVLDINEQGMPPEASNNPAYTALKENVQKLQELKGDYIAAQNSVAEKEQEIKEIDDKISGALQDAKDVMRDVFTSPFLLPGLWASMLPSMTPYGGGLVPPPFFVGPPSTIPGMIYLALLLIDAYEEKIHDDLTTDPNCEDQL